jgi:predicted RecA/RadA family phage recombinase
MNTWKRTGHRRPYTNTGSAIAAGDVKVMGTEIGVAVTDIAATTGTGEMSVSGVHTLAAASGQAWAIGATLYWSGTALTSTASGNTAAGKADAAKVSAATTADVLLNGRPGPDA